MHLFISAFDPSHSFIPHGVCYAWDAMTLFLNIAGDAMTSVAYFAISYFVLLLYRTRKDLPFRWMWALFGAFISICAFSHLLDIWNIWWGHYVFSGSVKVIMGVISLTTAYLMPRVVRESYALHSPTELIDANNTLAEEAELRMKAEAERDEIKARLKAALEEIDRIRVDSVRDKK